MTTATSPASASSRPSPDPAREPGRGPAMIAVEGVTKWFGDVVAVSEVSFSVGAGVTALLGPNGAGKSTVLRLLCGLTAPAKGTVRVLGRDTRSDFGVHRFVGLVPQQESVFENQSALEFVRLSAVLHNLADPDGAARRALHIVELDPDERRRLSTYSRGMRQRVKVAQAIAHNPWVIVLDEPLTGLDPRQRRKMTELFHYLGSQGRCVIVSSHVLEEVERFGSNVLVMAQGRLAAQGDFRAIRDLMDDRPHRLRIRTDQPYRLAGQLLAGGTAMGVRMLGPDEVMVDTTDVARFRREVAVVARQEQASLWEVTPLDDDLDSVFRYLVG